MSFVTICDGSYTLNVSQISEIDWKLDRGYATITMATGNEYDTDGPEDLVALAAAVGIRI